MTAVAAGSRWDAGRSGGRGCSDETPSHPSSGCAASLGPRRSAGGGRVRGIAVRRGARRACRAGRGGPVGRAFAGDGHVGLASRPMNRGGAPAIDPPSPGPRRRSRPPGGVGRPGRRGPPGSRRRGRSERLRRTGHPCPSPTVPPANHAPSAGPAAACAGLGRAVCGRTVRRGSSSPAWGSCRRSASGRPTSSPACAAVRGGVNASRVCEHAGPHGAFCPDGRLVASVSQFDAERHLARSRKHFKSMSRDVQLGVLAADLATDDARVTLGTIAPERLGVIYGAGRIAPGLGGLAAAAAVCTDASGRFDPTKFGGRRAGEHRPALAAPPAPEHAGLSRLDRAGRPRAEQHDHQPRRLRDPRGGRSRPHDPTGRGGRDGRGGRLQQHRPGRSGPDGRGGGS